MGGRTLVTRVSSGSSTKASTTQTVAQIIQSSALSNKPAVLGGKPIIIGGKPIQLTGKPVQLLGGKPGQMTFLQGQPGLSAISLVTQVGGTGVTMMGGGGWGVGVGGGVCKLRYIASTLSGSISKKSK